MKLLDDVKRCVDSARRYSTHEFTIVGELGKHDIRCRVFHNDSAAEFILTLLWINGEEPTEEEAFSLATLFALATHPDRRNAAPRLVGSDRSRTLPAGKEMRRYVYAIGSKGVET